MSKNSKLMSENLKEEIAKELGVYDQVKKDGGWENVSSKTCGNIVTKAIEIANRSSEIIIEQKGQGLSCTLYKEDPVLFVLFMQSVVFFGL